MKRFIKNILALWTLAMFFSVEAMAQDGTKWNCDYHLYEKDMTAYLLLSPDDNNLGNLDYYEVAAFVGKECRGVSSQKSPDGAFILRVWSNSADEDLTFKVYSRRTNTVYTTKPESPCKFQDGGFLGTIDAPVRLGIHFGIDEYTDIPSISNDIWKCFYTCYQNDVQSYLCVVDEYGNAMTPYGCSIGAFIGGECHGISQEPYWNSNSLFTFDLRIWTDDNINGVEFFLYNPETEEVTPLYYNPDDLQGDIVGSFDHPVVLSKERKKFTLTFATSTDEILSKELVYYGDSIKAPESRIHGYTFVGWDKPIAKTMPACDVTYTAILQANVHQLNYIVLAQSEQGMDTIPYRSFKYAFGEQICDTLPDINIVGYDYSPWTRTVQRVMDDEDINVYCERTIHRHTVKFLVDGKVVQISEQEFATPIILPTEPEKIGHSFAGWEPLVNAIVPDNDVEYRALFVKNEYHVNFIQADGQLVSSAVYAYGDKVVAPTDSVAKLEGYHFVKWEPEFNPLVEGDATYTAVYDINQYTVKFVDMWNDMLISYNMNYGSVISAQPSAPLVDGWTFAGWEPEFIPGVTTVPAKDVVFKAIYKQMPYTITYMVDDKTYFQRLLTVGDTIAPIPDPEKKGYTFLGWENLPQTMPDYDLVIQGHFKANTYTVTFITGEDENDKIVFEVEYGKPVTAPVPGKVGYTFVGWNLMVEPVMPDYDLTYTAVYARNKYSVIFYDYDGTTVLRKLTLAYGDEIAIPDDPTRRGYTFKSWNLSVEKTMPARNLTYVATYSVNLYKFIYMLDGVEYLKQEYTYGRLLTLIPYLTRQGYDFSGWSYTNPAEGESFNIPDYMPDHDVIVSGFFSQKNTFVYNGMEYSITDFEKRLAELVGLAKDAGVLSKPGMRRAPALEDGKLIIPSKVFDENTNDSCIVYSIAAKALEKAEVTNVVIPETVELIEPSALDNDLITNISFEGNKIPEFEANAFRENVIIDMPNVEEEKRETIVAEAKAELQVKNMDMAMQEEKACENDRTKVEQTYEVVVVCNKENASIQGAGQYKYGDVIVLSAEPIEGYTMQWHVGDSIVVGDTYVCSEACNLHAQLIYISDSYQLVYKIGDEVLCITDIDYNMPLSDIQAPTVPQKEGYTFQGWSSLPDVMPAHTVTVVGSYKINTYTVTFTLDGQVATTKEYTYGATIAMPVIEKTGYTVVWNQDAPEAVPAHDVTIDGSYEPNLYTITYMYGDEVLRIQQVSFDSPIPAFSYEPENTGSLVYTFQGWIGEDGKLFAHDKMTVPHDIVLQACVDVTDGIQELSSGLRVDVYNLSGIKVGTLLDSGNLRNLLPAGTYIVGGKKVQIAE